MSNTFQIAFLGKLSVAFGRAVGLPLLLCLFLCTCAPAQVNAQAYEVNVHPGQELLTMIQILAEQYRQPNKSTYQADFVAHFSAFVDHPAVVEIRNIEEKVYTDFPELGWCISNFPDPDLYLPEENLWYEQYGKERVQKILRLALDFADKSDFWSFYQAHEKDYAAWGAAVRQKLDSLQYPEILDEFYSKGAANHEQPTFYIALDPLNSWGAHAVPHVAELNPKFAKYKAYSLGYWNRESTEKDTPSFTGTSFLADLVWHEGSHIYLNEIIEANADKIATIKHLYNGDERQMKRQSINDWDYCFEENLVRGVVIALTKQHRSHRAYREQNADEILSGFIYAEDIADWLERVYLTPGNERSLGELLPGLVEMLDGKYEGVPK